MLHSYDELWAVAKVKALEAKNGRCIGELEMKISENAFTILQQYNDMKAQLDALCKHLGVKIEKE